MKNWKIPKKGIDKIKKNGRIIAYFALQEKILPQWKKIALKVLTDEETILINNSSCNAV